MIVACLTCCHARKSKDTNSGKSLCVLERTVNSVLHSCSRHESLVSPRLGFESGSVCNTRTLSNGLDFLAENTPRTLCNELHFSDDSTPRTLSHG